MVNASRPMLRISAGTRSRPSMLSRVVTTSNSPSLLILASSISPVCELSSSASKEEKLVELLLINFELSAIVQAGNFVSEAESDSDSESDCEGTSLWIPKIWTTASQNFGAPGKGAIPYDS